MKVLMISGSNRLESSNLELLKSIPVRFRKHEFQLFDISELPLFIDQGGEMKYPKVVMQWRQSIEAADLVIMCTPEYIHNMPAALKNALEWVTQSGELAFKKVLPMTYTPSRGRGEKAMLSLLWSLQALDTSIVGQLDLYQGDDETEKLLYDVLEEVLSE